MIQMTIMGVPAPRCSTVDGCTSTVPGFDGACRQADVPQCFIKFQIWDCAVLDCGFNGPRRHPSPSEVEREGAGGLGLGRWAGGGGAPAQKPAQASQPRPSVEPPIGWRVYMGSIGGEAFFLGRRRLSSPSEREGGGGLLK